MNKKMVLKILVTILLLFAVLNIVNIFETVNLLFTHTPAKFERYQNLRHLATNKNFDIQTIETKSFSSGKIKDESHIWIAQRKDEGANDKLHSEVFYKINEDGMLIDSLRFINEFIEPIDDYLINIEKGFYCTWLKDGDASRKPFNLIQNGALLTTEEIKNYIKNAEHFFYDYVLYSETQKHLLKVVFYKDRKWSELYAESNEGFNKTYKYSAQLNFEALNNLVDVSFFKKKEWNGHITPNFSYNVNGLMPPHWRGVSYYDLKFKNGIILFKEQNSVLYKGSKVPKTKISIYTNPNGKYIIINDGGFGDKDFTLYLIRL
ncbi:hypothetical protein [Zobellia uliginosa]|uniref:hypothetical protein n=1 Tax=Zobellia uliginosa TaxID=143224 RepID=UPI001C06D009|nr:hypothetical protein [Zobellia uliginosa]MBU2946294.1 hypothetical protein [Zobellia uliginosa]